MKQLWPPQAATEFEQKVLNWTFYPFLKLRARTKRPPPAWLASMDRQILIQRIGFLLLSMLMIWFSISIWDDYLYHWRPLSFIGILSFIIDHPRQVCNITPRSIGEEFFSWFAVATIVFVVSGFIMLRVKNWPLELRLVFSCLLVAIPAFANANTFFAMPCWVGEGMFMIFILLWSVVAIALLVCGIRIKKWPTELLQSLERPIVGTVNDITK